MVSGEDGEAAAQSQVRSFQTEPRESHHQPALGNHKGGDNAHRTTAAAVGIPQGDSATMGSLARLGNGRFSRCSRTFFLIAVSAVICNARNVSMTLRPD